MISIVKRLAKHAKNYFISFSTAQLTKPLSSEHMLTLEEIDFIESDKRLKHFLGTVGAHHEKASIMLRNAMLTMLLFSLFAVIILGTPDQSLVVKSSSVKLPFIGTPIDFQSLLIIVPLILAVLFLYLHIVRAHLCALEYKINDFVQDTAPSINTIALKYFYRYPAIFNLPGIFARLLSSLIFYYLTPAILLLYYYKVLPRPNSEIIIVITLTWCVSLISLKLQLDHNKNTKSTVKVIISHLSIIFVTLVLLMDISSRVFSTNIASIFPLHRSLQLQKVNLSNRNLQKVRLSKSNFFQADLSGSLLDGADLKFTNFDGAILKNTSFRNADLTGANFKGANISGANFSFANLSGTNFIGAIGWELGQILLTQTDNATKVPHDYPTLFNIESPGIPRRELARHFVNIEAGHFVDKGSLWSTEKEFNYVVESLSSNLKSYQHILLYFTSSDGLGEFSRTVSALKSGFKRNGIYPIFFLSDLKFRQRIKHKTAKIFEDKSSDEYALEQFARNEIQPLWDGLIYNERLSFSKGGVGDKIAEKLTSLKFNQKGKLSIHIVGTRFASYSALSMMSALNRQAKGKTAVVSTLNLLAPLIDTRQFYEQFIDNLIPWDDRADIYVVPKDNGTLKFDSPNFSESIYQLFSQSVIRPFEFNQVVTLGLNNLEHLAVRYKINIMDLTKTKGESINENRNLVNYIISAQTKSSQLDNDVAIINNILERILNQYPLRPFTTKELIY